MSAGTTRWEHQIRFMKRKKIHLVTFWRIALRASLKTLETNVLSIVKESLNECFLCKEYHIVLPPMSDSADIAPQIIRLPSVHLKLGEIRKTKLNHSAILQHAHCLTRNGTWLLFKHESSLLVKWNSWILRIPMLILKNAEIGRLSKPLFSCVE